MAAGDGDGGQGDFLEGLIAAEDFNEGAFAGGVDDGMDLLVRVGKGSDDGAEAGGEV